ncbi:MAG: acetyl-CoA carboxylase biotin carboxylase subunit [Flavobacteriales bacterium]|nr:acetyl-CoA carboxylase biotin carboxylase subunit [Flavobacteriales bacterium]
MPDSGAGLREIRKVLVANRGEIAVRILRTCRAMGIETVAVYSDADRDSRHVRMADKAFRLGAGPSSESYLKADEIIRICKEEGVDAIHPGYGFLSENAGFARKLKEADIILIGPSASAMELMGSKLASKQAVAEYGVPLVPGTKEAVDDPEEAKKIALGIGFPVLIKASAGGGGKGMRIVRNEAELDSQMKMAISEAISSFGDGSVFIEKYVEGPRHIEIQIMADEHGNCLYLFERECSVQRRHQKLVEEAPSAILTPEMRKAMGEAAVQVARACNYTGAGTVEFLVDATRSFYFLEMNTRLQVEHPVTELITGLDLVEWQIRVARGEELAFGQDDLQINGHALELRVCAEDPVNDFLPDIGTLTRYERPELPHVRVDDFVDEGYSIPIYYDNMFAKLIVWAPDRSGAIARMLEAIEAYKVEGVATTLEFGKFVMKHPAFISGEFDTHFVQNHFSPEALQSTDRELTEAAALLAAYLHKNTRELVLPIAGRESEWYRKR